MQNTNTQNIPVRSVDIEITPAYYDRYLKENFQMNI